MNEPNQTGEDAIPRVLPRGPHKLGPEVVRASQRVRMLDAMVELCGERELSKITVADVISLSGVSRGAFYEQFENKQACFVAAYDHGVERIQDAIVAAVAAESTWQGRLRAICVTFTHSLASNPAFAKLFLIEIFSAGIECRRHRDAAFERFVVLYEELHRQAKLEWPEIPELDRQMLIAVLGAVGELATYTLLNEGAERIADLAEPLMALAWTVGKGLELPPEPSRP